MAPNKIDQQFKVQLESRQLQPSSQAWERLSSQLDTHQKNEKRVFVQWLSVAAALIIALSVGATFIFKSSLSSELPVIVDAPTEDVKASRKINTSPMNDNAESVQTETLLESEKSNILTTEEKQPIPKQRKTIQIAEKKETTPVQIQSIEDQKISEVVAAIGVIQNEKNEVTEEEIEALLKNAQRDILLDKIYNQQTKKVDATVLLAQVEGEINHSFRDKVFDALKSSFITVKTAVADRKY